ncbi:MAG: (2Fe-2S)-binding protein [Planctomycetes bacterium]|nr:(2Fe-2S)-binding protein [Planctomycetota bacterium]
MSTERPGDTVCECFDISRDDVYAIWRKQPTVAAVEKAFGCGRDCGNCVPRLHSLLKFFLLEQASGRKARRN